MVVVLLRPLRPLQRPDLVAGHEHALLPAHQLQLRAWLQLGEAALVAVGDGGAVAGLDDDARHLAVAAEHAPQVVQGEGGALVAPHQQPRLQPGQAGAGPALVGKVQVRCGGVNCRLWLHTSKLLNALLWRLKMGYFWCCCNTSLLCLQLGFS